MFMEQHFLRSPLRVYSDMDADNNNAGYISTAAMMEKARTQLQMWGRAGGLGFPPGAGDILLPYPGARPPMGLWHTGLLLPPPGHPGPPPQQLTPPPPSTSAASTPSPSPQEKLPRPAAVFPQQHRFSPYPVLPKRETVPTRN